jgi:hypothetical protein
MEWKKLKEVFGPKAKSAPPSQTPSVRPPAPPPSPIKWIEAANNPWGVPVLDIRPVTQTMLSASKDPKHATNALSFGNEDGTSFIGKGTRVTRAAKANLRFPIDRLLAEGVLFAPVKMEQKWAIFFHQGNIICVRSWLREVQLTAAVEAHSDYVNVIFVRGTLGADDEPSEFTERELDFLLKSHALHMLYPAPLPAGMEKNPQMAAMWCMSMFGNMALFATPHPVLRRDPDQPLRSQSLLHIAAARGYAPGIEAQLSAGVPVDLLAGDGLAPLHWGLVSRNPAIMSLLLERGSPVDVRSAEGATPLMYAVQHGEFLPAAFLLNHGADVNARDRRGFTALHRAAEYGHLDLTKMLLDRGASPNPEAQGHTPRSLAESKGHKEIAALFPQPDATLGGKSG